MSASEKVQGLAAANSLLANIPSAAHEQMIVELGIVGRELLAQQRADVAKDSGELEGALKFKVLVDKLRLKVGLFDQRRRGGRVTTWYGRVVELGRRAQTVIVQRRHRVEGRLRSRRGRKVASDIAATYSMKVSALAPRPFIFKGDPQGAAERRLANFWSQTINRAGGGA